MKYHYCYFLLYFFYCTFSFHNCFACSNYDGSTDSEAANLHRKSKGLSNLYPANFGNDADEGTPQITTCDRGANQCACTTCQWGEQWGEKKNHKVLKDAYEKEAADIKEKRKNVWCHLALTLDVTTLMLMRYDCGGEDGIRDEEKALKLLQENFQSVETPTVVTLHSLLDCSSMILRIWKASSSNDRGFS